MTRLTGTVNLVTGSLSWSTQNTGNAVRPRLLRIARLILAALPQEVLGRLSQKFRIPVYQVKWIEAVIARTGVPNPDTVTEWVLGLPDLDKLFNISHQESYVENVAECADFFFKYSGTPKFREIVLKTELSKKPGFSLRNIFSYSRMRLDDIKRQYFGSSDDPYERARLEKLKSGLPPGAKLFFNNGEIQIVEMTDAEAACSMASGTQWCTSERDSDDDNAPAVARQYLRSGHLYLILLNGRKVAQFHWNNHTYKLSLENLQRQGIKIEGPIGEALLETGLAEKAFTGLVKSAQPGKIDEHFSSDIKNKILEDFSKDPAKAAEYADYAFDRFPLGEPAIVAAGGRFLRKYEMVLDECHKLMAFKRDWAGRLPE